MNAQCQEEEIEALKAIYDTDFKTIESTYSITIRLGDDAKHLSMDLLIILPDDYPSNSPPVFEIKNALWLESQDSRNIAENLTRLFSENKGEVVVYQWVEWIKEYVSKLEIEGRDTREAHCSETCVLSSGMEENGSLEGGGNQQDLDLEQEQESITPAIFHGEPLTDRKSTFQAHVSEVISPSEVKAVLKELKTNRKIATATHNILAYRLFDSSRNVFQQDCDDDGEHAAGSRLLHLLQIMDIRNAMVVVTRWYGGIQLHADRFKHINNVARILFQETAIGQQHKDVQRSKGKSSKSHHVHKTGKGRTK